MVHFPQIFTFLEVLGVISFNWDEIVNEILIHTLTDEFIWLPLASFNWTRRPEYPSCVMINVSQYFDVKEKGISQIFFDFNKINSIGVQVLIEDEKLVCSRTIKNNLMSYTGPTRLGKPNHKKNS